MLFPLQPSPSSTITSVSSLMFDQLLCPWHILERRWYPMPFISLKLSPSGFL
jgi:hypothetical protein